MADWLNRVNPCRHCHQGGIHRANECRKSVPQAVLTTIPIAECLIQVRTLANVGLSLLGEMAQPAFKVWDVVDTVDTMSIDLANQTPFDVALENLYSLAYRYEVFI